MFELVTNILVFLDSMILGILSNNMLFMENKMIYLSWVLQFQRQLQPRKKYYLWPSLNYTAEQNDYLLSDNFTFKVFYGEPQKRQFSILSHQTRANV